VPTARLVEFYRPVPYSAKRQRKRAAEISRAELDLTLRIEEAALLLLKDSEPTFRSGNEELAMREYRDGLMLLADAISMRRAIFQRMTTADSIILAS
jgi:hypothetical protein